MFEKLSDKLESVFKKLRGQSHITEDNVKEALREIRVAFLEADVHFQTTKDFIARVRDRAVGQEVLQSVSPGQQIVKITYDELTAVLGGESAEPNYQGKTPIPLIVMGLQGSGKTTFCGKLALRLRNKWKKNPMLVACDVHRPAAIDQLQTLGKSLGIHVYAEGQGDPVQIAKHALEYARVNSYDTVIIDTAGRLQIDNELMTELDNICKETKPQHRFFVADAMTGQTAVAVASEFHSRIGFDGVVLTKMDGDTRGGAALSVRTVTGKPLMYTSMGEKLDALDVFYPDRMASRILGMGDVLSLVEKAQEVVDEKQAKVLQKKMMENKFDLNDFLNQLRQIKKMGSIADLMGMIPGMSKLKGVNVDSKQLVYVEAILSSMTMHERTHPKVIDGNRRRRIAMGSGTDLQRVNQVLKQFEQMQKMMKQIQKMGKGGMQRMMSQMKGKFPGM